MFGKSLKGGDDVYVRMYTPSSDIFLICDSTLDKLRPPTQDRMHGYPDPDEAWGGGGAILVNPTLC